MLRRLFDGISDRWLKSVVVIPPVSFDEMGKEKEVSRLPAE